MNRDLDVFDAIAANLMNQTALITKPGAIDPRWPSIIAQAFREGIGAYAAQAPGGMLFKVERDGTMAIIAITEG